jgi:general secretion pathway protein D
VDVEILEVSRARAKQYGLNLSQYQVGTIFSGGAALLGDARAQGLFNLNTISQGISTADFYMTVPQAVVRFLASDSSSRQIAKPQLRGMEGEKLTLNLGDEIPVPSTVYTPIATGGAAINPLTSFSYRPVGVNIEMTPRVTMRRYRPADRD